MTTMDALWLCGLNNTIVYVTLTRTKQKAVVLYSDLSLSNLYAEMLVITVILQECVV